MTELTFLCELTL